MARIEGLRYGAAASTNYSSLMGTSLMLLSAFSCSLLASMVHWGAYLGFSVNELTLYRALSQIIISVALLMKQPDPLASLLLNLKNLECVVIAHAVFEVSSSVTFFSSSQLISTGNCLTLKALVAVITPIAAYFTLGESISQRHVVSIIVSFGATLLIAQPTMLFGHNEKKQNPLGYLFAIASAAFASGIFITTKKVKHTPTVVLFFVDSCFIGLYSLFALSWNNEPLRLFNLHENVGHSILCLFILGISGSISQLALISGTVILKSTFASILRTTDIVWSFFF